MSDEEDKLDDMRSRTIGGMPYEVKLAVDRAASAEAADAISAAIAQDGDPHIVVLDSISGMDFAEIEAKVLAQMNLRDDQKKLAFETLYGARPPSKEGLDAIEARMNRAFGSQTGRLRNAFDQMGAQMQSAGTSFQGMVDKLERSRERARGFTQFYGFTDDMMPTKADDFDLLDEENDKRVYKPPVAQRPRKAKPKKVAKALAKKKAARKQRRRT